MKTMPKICAVAVLAVSLAGCAGLNGDIDDGGRAYREAQNAPVDSNLEKLAAEPSITLLRERIPSRAERAEIARAASVPQSACDAERWQVLIGRERDGFENESLPERTRVVRDGMLVTQDYFPDRLNIYLGPDGRVFRVVCG